MKNNFDILIIGGGAAGFFAAINIAEKYPQLKINILERGKDVLTKVKVSGGGRCNVTHAEFIPKDLTQNYPRGKKELLGPFHTFMTGDTMDWFKQRGVPLKIEEDGRVFPVSNSSQSIIDCFLLEAKRLGITIHKNTSVKKITKKGEVWITHTNTQDYFSKKIVLATGSNPKIWKLLENLGHTIIPPVPSLFTFNIKDSRIKEIPGVAIANVKLKIKESNINSQGPLLITHWGLSGPAILKLSAFAALELAKRKYNFIVEINFTSKTFEFILEDLMTKKERIPKKTIYHTISYGIPKRLWRKLVEASQIHKEKRWAEVTKKEVTVLANQLTKAAFQVNGKSTFKEEFVTAGGVSLKEINFKNYESKLQKSIYLAGEILNIDAVTGGFNFQNAWTGGFIIAKNINN